VAEDVLEGQDLMLPARRLADDGLTAWADVLARGYEGLVAKDPASPYVGGRTLSWL
jgi:ATP-dependent DNA ligase